MQASSRTVDLMLAAAATPFVALVGGMFTESIMMMAVTANRRRMGYVHLTAGWRGVWQRLFPPPPGADDPRPLRMAYKIASHFVTGGLIGIGIMVVAIAAIFIFTKGH